MRSAVMGLIPVEHWFRFAGELTRHLFDTPRRRNKQCSVALRAQAWLKSRPSRNLS